MIEHVSVDRLVALELLALLRDLAQLAGGRPGRALQKETQRLRQALEDAVSEADRQPPIPEL
jgi:hypothetical protein